MPPARVAVIEVKVYEELVCKFAMDAAMELKPLGAFFGGVLAQVVKCGGKYTPVPRWLHFSAMEVLPSVQPVDTAPQVKV
jgi:hypothetical protein